MDNKASKNRAREMAFLVDAELLRRLAVVLAEVGEPLRYSVKFSDDTNIEYSDAEEIIKQPNTVARSIISITASTPGERKESAYVVLRTTPSPNVEYTVNGPQQRVVYFGIQLDDWVAAIRQWYSPFHFSIVGLVVFCFALYAPIFLWGHIAPHLFPAVVVQGKASSWIKNTSILGLWGAEALALSLFPNGTFAIGQGVKRNDFLKYLRGMVVAFVLSVLAGMIANLLKR
jgi:hypothetical protein